MAFKKTIAGSSLPKGIETADNVNSTIESTVETSLAALVASAPETLDTLNELAAALGDDANFATTVTTALSNKSDTGHGHVISDVTNLQTSLDGKASSSHSHAISDVTNLQTSLDGKSGLTVVEPSANTNTAISVGYVGLPQVILNSGNLTLSKAHAGEHIYVTGASQTITIPANSSVPFEIGTTIVVINGNVTSQIAITSNTLRLAGGTTTGTRSLAVYGMATLVKISATEWIASGNGLT